jgi:hypothetical protein
MLIAATGNAYPENTPQHGKTAPSSFAEDEAGSQRKASHSAAVHYKKRNWSRMLFRLRWCLGLDTAGQ